MKNKLDQLISAFNDSSQRVKVGVLGQKDHREGGTSNATIGAKHEFGMDDLPVRSFLRMPISEKMQTALEKAGLYEANVLKQAMSEKSIDPILVKIGIVAESIVQEAFDTRGFGQWKESNMDHKKNHQTLVETTQLRKSITSALK